MARQAVHRVRADLDPALRDRLPAVQRALIRGLEVLGDPGAAWQVARQAPCMARYGNERRCCHIERTTETSPLGNLRLILRSGPRSGVSSALLSGAIGALA